MSDLTIKKTKITKEYPIVCVPVVASTGEDIIRRIRLLAEDHVRMVEWRLDFFEKWNDVGAVSEILAELEYDTQRTILLLTLRTVSEGGHADIAGDELRAYYTLLSKLRGYELIDLQYNDVDEFTVRKISLNKKITVLSYHNFSTTPDDAKLRKLLSEMIEYPCDILKYAFMPTNEEDVDRTIDFSRDIRREWHGRQIVISMGALGKRLRRNPFITGSCLTFGCLEGEKSAPGQVYYRELKEDISSLSRKRGIVFLTGYMGTGKSTIGRELRDRTKRRLVDLDSLIEKNAGCTISKMMEERGEKYFRDVEANTLSSLAGQKNLIVSCGGGIILRRENRKFMKENGFVVLLEATPEQIYGRIKNDTSRPLLAGKMSVDYIALMKAERDPLYHEFADITIDTGECSKFDICDELCKTIGYCLL